MSATQVTSSNSKEFLEFNKEAFVVLVFDAEFTGQEALVAAAIKSLSSSDELKDKVITGIVDAEENNDLTTQLSVLSVPMIACIVRGKVVRKIDTLEPSKLITALKEELRKHELLSANPNDATKTDNNNQTGVVIDEKEKFNNYLKRLINRAPVMIFMKGDPKTPRCGFSRQLIELLSRHNNIKFETFDILQDEEVRQGLKEYSDWPTYPQIYAKGEFVGGLDILKQLEESGELEATFL